MCSRRCQPPASPSTTGARGSTTSGHKSSDMVCMDSEIATHAASSQSDDNGKLFFLSQFASGSADESKYKVGHEVGCSVCGV